MVNAFVFDAYGTLFDVHAAIARHRAAAGPDADAFWINRAQMPDEYADLAPQRQISSLAALGDVA